MKSEKKEDLKRELNHLIKKRDENTALRCFIVADKGYTAEYDRLLEVWEEICQRINDIINKL